MLVKVTHKLDLGPELPEEYKQQALKLGENPDLVPAYLDEFRNMIFERGLCTSHRTDNEYLLRFLRARFFNVEKAHDLMVRYFEFRESSPELYKGMSLDYMYVIGDLKLIIVEPYRDQEGRRILNYKFGNWKLPDVSTMDILRTTFLLQEIGIMEPISQVAGAIGIFDFEGLTLRHCLQITPSLAQNMIKLLVTCTPSRTIAIHIVNQNWIFETAFQMFKPFLNKRMTERIFFHGKDMESLHKHVSPAHLPEEYGGQMAELSYRKWFDFFKKSEKLLKELQQLGYVVPESWQEENNNNN